MLTQIALQLDAGTRRHQRLLANLPFFPEARHDSCQRRILLRKMGILDMGPCAPYYALKINRYLFWSAADLDVATICHVQVLGLLAFAGAKVQVLTCRGRRPSSSQTCSMHALVAEGRMHS